MTSSVATKARLYLTNPVFWIFVSALLVSLSLIAVIYGLFRGFDWTDEAWAFSLSASGRVSVGEPWAFQYLVHPFLEIFGDRVISVRILRFVTFIVLGVAISFGFNTISKSIGKPLSKIQLSVVFIATQIGTVLVWSWPPRYFAYNEITSIIVQLVAIGIATQIICARHSSKLCLPKYASMSLWTIVGLLSGVLFYGRFTGFLLVAPVAFFSTLLEVKGRKLLSSFIFLSTFLLGIAFPSLLGLPLSEYVSSIWLNVTDPNFQAANNHPSGLVQMYFENLWGVLLTVLPVAILLFSSIVLFSNDLLRFPGNTILFRRAGFILFAVTIAITFIYVLQSGGGAERTGKIAIVSIVLGAILLFIFVSPDNESVESTQLKGLSWFRTFVAVMLIFSAPIVASFGTNNPLSIHFGFDASIWLGAAGFGIALWYQNSVSKKSSLWPPVISLLVISTLSVIAIVGEARSPYRSASFKANSEEITNPGPLQGLFVTLEEKTIFDWLREEAEKLNAANVPTLSLKSAGNLLSFNNSSFASPWLESFWPASFWSITNACRKEIPSDLIVLVPGTVPQGAPEWNDLSSTLEKSCRLNFPGDFTLVAEKNSENPTYAMSIWRLKQ